MGNRIIDQEITLLPYFDNYEICLSWYQDYDICKQVDNIDYLYDMDRLKRMYEYLNLHGLCYYIQYQGSLIGDVALTDDNEICIVISKGYQNKGIGKKVIREILKLARENEIKEVTANIYSFNKQSQRAFKACGFIQVDQELYKYEIKDL